MSRSIVWPCLVVLALLVVSGCGTGPAGTGSSSGASPTKERTITIGFTASLTGRLNVESTRQKHGLELWMNQLNAQGGLELGDGSRLKFASKFYDDESSKERVQELYTRLSTDDGADFLIGPYSSGLTDAAALIAEQYGKILIATGAASDSTFRRGFSLVYQIYTPASRYLTDAVDIIRKVAPTLRRVAIVAENDKFAGDVCAALRARVTASGMTIALSDGYDGGTSDFAPLINRIQAASPEAILGGGHFNDGCTLARQLFEKKVPAGFVILLVAPPEPSFEALGDAAVGVIGPSQWEPIARVKVAPARGNAWAGPTGQEFVAAYRKAHGEDPAYHAAGGYAAGLALQRAIERAASTATEPVKAALDAVDLETFFGRIRFDPSRESHGLQIGHSMVFIQYQRDRSGRLAKQAVWPPEVATGPVVFPVR